MATDGANANTPNSPPLDQSAWEGDRMFNIYIYDYCQKRGFRKTASELMQEAQIPAHSQPPINAKQGLLFEWWSVFWVLFTAKSNGQGPDDALLYTQHQIASQSAAQKANRPGANPPRYANGVRPPTQNGPQPNGVVHQPPPGTLPNGVQNAVPFPGNAPQPNGVPGTSAGPPGGVPPPQANGPAPQHAQGQRPVAPQQRAPNGAPFQSPTMAHSPPNVSGGPQQGNPASGIGPVGANAPLTQMRSNMPPPPTGPMGNPQHTPQPQYQLVGRSPSNPGSPASALTARSPSLANRLTPEFLNSEMSRIPPQLMAKLKQDMGPAYADKDPSTFTYEEKQQIVTMFRRTPKPPNAPGPIAGPSGQPGPGPMQHPAGLRTPQMPPNTQQPGQQPIQPQPGQNPQQRGAKRNSTSPGQEPEQLPRNESSPPDRKRVRRSPGGEQSQPPMAPMYQTSQPGAPSMQHMPPNGMMRQGVPMQPFGGQPMVGMGGQMMGHNNMGTPQMGPMNAAMMGGPPQGSPMNTAQMQQYRHAMVTMHKAPHMPQQMHSGNVPSPSASGVQSQGDGSDQQRQNMQYMPGGMPPGNRMPQNKPMSGMHPPPSPAMNNKQPGGPSKPDSEPNGHLDRSPQNVAIGTGGPQQPHPGQPAQPGGPPTSGPSNIGTPAPPTPTASSMTAPSPSAILGTSTPSMSHPPPPPLPPVPAPEGLDPSTFPNLDFATISGDFDGNPDLTLFGDTESSLNFERDFAAWFDPGPAGGA
ncbi:hypothetical protein C8Q78DRAFT_964327 [Trametes maxima]|nr:hypothetical protein C8Q78DRAFT_964327 [Trametes maxima]